MKRLSLIKNELARTGISEIDAGAWIWERESIIEDQKSWGDEDGCKGNDFTAYPYWLEIDVDNIAPEGFETIKECVDALRVI